MGFFFSAPRFNAVELRSSPRLLATAQKHQLPSAFAWVVGHGGCAVRRELVHSVHHKRAEKLCMACWHASPLLPWYRTCSACS